MSFREEMLNTIKEFKIITNLGELHIPISSDNHGVIHDIIDDPKFLEKVQDDLCEYEEHKLQIPDTSVRFLNILISNINNITWEIKVSDGGNK